MGEFLTELDEKRFTEDKNVFIKLLAPLVYVDSKGKKHTAPKDFESDGSSQPQITWSIIGHPFGLYLESSVIHDWLYSILGTKTVGVVKRGYADWVFLDAMKTQKISFWKRHVMHKFVKVFGGIHRFFTQNRKK